MADIRGTDIRQEAEQGLKDMASLISRGDYNLALVKGRQTIELLVKGYAKENRLIYTDLADTIENLYGENTIGRGSRDAFHAIRQFGNRAVHDNDNDPKDAESSYYLLKNEIEVYLNTNAGTKNRAPVNISREQGSSAGPVYNDEAADIRFTRDAAQKAEQSADTYRAPVRQEQKRRTEDAAGEDPRTQGKLRTEVGDRRQGDQAKKTRQGASQKSGRTQSKSKVPTREDRLRASKQNSRGGTVRGQRNGGLDIYGLLRILIPLICILLLIILLRSCMADKPQEETTTPVQTTESTAPTTVAPTTEAPTTEAQPTSYVVTGNNVNVRYADNQQRIYEQLSSGTEIGEVETIEGSDYVRFTRDGIQLVIHKDYIAPIEN